MHVGPDCTTFSHLAGKKHGRHASNFYMGSSAEAFDTNQRLAHTLAILYLLRARNPALMITWENPDVRAPLPS